MVPFLWGLIVLSALIGWGLIAARLAGVPGGNSPDWGLAAGWGMAALLALGGVLSLTGLALPPVLFAVVAAGVAMHLAAVFKGRASWEKPKGLFWLMVAVAALPLLTRYVSVVSYQAMSCGDDDVVYFTYVSRLLQTGTLIEPFGLRRLAAFGGQTFLQSLVVMAGSELNAYLMDRGIAYIISFGLVAGYLRGHGFGLAFSHMVGLILAVILPLPLLNSSSHVTGLVMFLTLFRTLERLPGPKPGAFPAAGPLWLVGMAAAGASSLKAHYLGVAAVTVFAYWLIACLRPPRGNEGGNEGGTGTVREPAWRSPAITLGHLGLSSLLFLAPWMGLLYRSSGTILFPFFQGNHRPGFAESYSGAMPFPELLGFLADFFTAPQVLLFFVPMGLYLFRRGSAAGLALYAGALVTAAVTVSTLTFDNLETLHRYVAPFLNAAFIATVIVFLREILGNAPGNAPGKNPAGPGRKLGDGILVVLVVVLLPVPIAKDINRLTHGSGKQAVVSAETRVAHARMQAAVPEGERVLAALDRPYWLDYKRNDIINIDVPGAVSPDPGMPFFKGPRALKDYLLGRSIPFVAFRDFDGPGGCLYRRVMWDFYAKSSHPMWRAESKFFLDFMDNVQALAKTEDLVFQRNGLSVIRLR